MNVDPRIEHLPARFEVAHAHSSHDKVRQVFGTRPATPLEEGLAAMAAWVRAHGARQSAPFGAIEVTRKLPASWL